MFNNEFPLPREGVVAEGRITFTPGFANYLVGRKKEEFMHGGCGAKDGPGWRFGELTPKVEGKDTIWYAKFWVKGASLTGYSRNSVVSNLMGTFAHAMGQANPIRYMVDGFKPNQVKFSVDPQWLAGQEFIVGGSYSNNRIFTVIGKDRDIYTVDGEDGVSLVKKEDPIYGCIRNVQSFSGTIGLIRKWEVVKTVGIGEISLAPVETATALGMAIAKAAHQDPKAKLVLEPATMTAPQRFVSRMIQMIGAM